MQILAILILCLIGLAILIPLAKYFSNNAASLGLAGLGCSAALLQGVSGLCLYICIPVFLISTVILATGHNSETVTKIFFGSLIIGVISAAVFVLAMLIEEATDP